MSAHEPPAPDALGGRLSLEPSSAAAILLAVSSPYLWTPLLGRPLLAWSVDVFERADDIGQLVLAVARDRAKDAEAVSQAAGWRKTRIVPVQGDWREALRLGLDAVAVQPSSPQLVVVHEAARPLVTAPQIAAGLTAAGKTGAATAGEPVKETIKRVRDGHIVETIPRERLISAQTPLVFTPNSLRVVLAAPPPVRAPASPLALVSAALVSGIAVTAFPGTSENFIVQANDDLAVATALLQRRLSATP